MPRRIIIDTDPGQDDAVAILLALASPELEILGITAVAGNVPLALTQVNARKVLELGGRGDIPVFAGCEAPLARPLVTAEHVHGRTGLDGIELPAPALPLASGHAVDFLIETLTTEPSGSVTLCALGPLTNLATALDRAPGIAPRIREIVLMGGARLAGGNITPAAEFNIFVDPEAAATVFGAGIPLTMLPLDATHQALVTPARLQAIRDCGRVGPACASWLDFHERHDLERHGAQGGPLHDPTVIAFLLAPGLFTGRHVNVEIELEGRFTAGMTVADWWGVSGRPPNARFIEGLDADGFFALLVGRLARL